MSRRLAHFGPAVALTVLGTLLLAFGGRIDNRQVNFEVIGLAFLLLAGCAAFYAWKAG